MTIQSKKNYTRLEHADPRLVELAQPYLADSRRDLMRRRDVALRARDFDLFRALTYALDVTAK